MRLLLDVGNTRIKWAWWDRGLKPGGAIVHRERSPEAALDAVDLRLQPTEIWVACVAAPALRAALGDWAQRISDVSPRWVKSSQAVCGVRCAYAEPEKLGVDRWLSVIGAYHHAAGAACVVDAGSALTLDVVDARGQHLGGLITPGLGRQRQGLRQDTQVRSQDASAPLTWLGKDTDTAVTWGTLHAVIGMIERVYAAISREHGRIMPILTGGEAGLLLPYLGADWLLRPDLVLEGLARVALEELQGRKV